jgi:hypothetical protein
MSVVLGQIITFLCFLWIVITGGVTAVIGLLRYFGRVEPLLPKETLEKWVRDEIPAEISDQMWRGDSAPPKLKPESVTKQRTIQTTEEKKGEKT